MVLIDVYVPENSFTMESKRAGKLTAMYEKMSKKDATRRKAIGR